MLDEIITGTLNGNESLTLPFKFQSPAVITRYFPALNLLIGNLTPSKYPLFRNIIINSASIDSISTPQKSDQTDHIEKRFPILTYLEKFRAQFHNIRLMSFIYCNRNTPTLIKK